MSQQQQKEKGSGYINVIADLTILQSIMCCNNDMNKSSTEADTPRNRSSIPSTFIQTREETSEETSEDIHVQVSK